MEYDRNNIFGRIIRGELPANKVYEDEHTLAFMDIMPMTTGHFLVLPKAEAVNIFDIPDADLASLIKVVRKLARAAKQALEADGITIQQFNGAPAGQSVFHMHFHVLPRWAGIPLRPHSGNPEEPEVLAQQAEQIRRVLV